MEQILLGRYRNIIILVAVLFAQILGLAVQVKRPLDADRPHAGSAPLIRLWAQAALTPVEKLLVGAGQWVRGVWDDYVDLRGVRQQNQELRAQLDRARIEQVRLSEDAAQARRLQVLFEFQEQFISRTVAAQVIGSSGTRLSRVVYIDKGSDHGIAPDMAVITPDGAVGKVLRVLGSSAQVLLINDPTSGVGALLEGSRLQGVIKGTPMGELMLHYVMQGEPVAAGELVITSGGDRIFPKGLPIGRVAQVDPGSDLFQNIRLKPAANLDRLEEVLVVTGLEYRTPQVEPGTVPLRAADILAERLPKVPPKPEAAKPAAAAGAIATTAPATTTPRAIAAGTQSAPQSSPAGAAPPPEVSGEERNTAAARQPAGGDQAAPAAPTEQGRADSAPQPAPPQDKPPEVPQ